MVGGWDEMESADEKLARIGKPIREALEAEACPLDDIRVARAGFLHEVATRNARAAGARKQPSSFWRTWRPWFLVAATASGGFGFWTWTRTPISFQVGPAASAGKLGDSLEASTRESLPLRFSEGSQVVLADGGRMRVLSTDARGARVLLENGSMDVSIAHRRDGRTHWSFEAGPFRVVVTGTRFRMAFRPEDQHFTLSTEEGQVVASGGCMASPTPVARGERLDLTCLRPTPPTQPPPMEKPATASASIEPTEALRDQAPVKGSAWRELLAAGRLAEGLRAAEGTGFDRVCKVASPKELLALSDAARLFGRPGRAVTSLRMVRQRFPGTNDAATAAFTLGRIAFERQHDYAEAATWFAACLREQPNGPLMGDSFGRLMEARLRSGDQTGARTDAEQYLRRFPEGPYASEARGILSK